MNEETTTSSAARRPARRLGVLAVVLATSLVAAGCFIPYDFTGSAGADLVYRDQTTGEWFVVGDPTPFHVGTPGGDPVPGTYDGDAKWEAAEVVDPVGWVTAGDAGTIDHGPQLPTLVSDSCGLAAIPVPADWTGDAATEPAWYVNGEWQILGEPVFVPTNSPSRLGCADEHDVAVPADYDGDGKAEAAVHRPGTGRFWIDGEAGPRELPVHLGYPTAGDFDGDGTDEPALLRPDGTLHTETATYAAASPGAFANALVPVVADHDDDGDDDPAAYDMNSGAWWVEDALVTTLDAPDEVPVAVRPWLMPSIVHIAWLLECEQTPTSGCPTDATDGDLDGDGAAEITWFSGFDGTSTTFHQAGTALPIATFDLDEGPAGGDYDGDGAWDLAVAAPAVGYWETDSAVGDLAMPVPACDPVPVSANLSIDLMAVVGDWDGDGRDEPGLYCRSDGTWHLPGHAPVTFGEPDTGDVAFDLPVPGDYDGDGDDEPGLYRPRDGSWLALGAPAPIAVGMGIGMPLVADVDGDGDDDPVLVSMNQPGQWQGTDGTWQSGPGGASPTNNYVFGAPADHDGDGAAERAALYSHWDPPGAMLHEVDGSTPTSIGAGRGIPGTWTSSAWYHIIWATFVEQQCDAGVAEDCPRPLPGP